MSRKKMTTNEKLAAIKAGFAKIPEVWGCMYCNRTFRSRVEAKKHKDVKHGKDERRLLQILRAR